MLDLVGLAGFGSRQVTDLSGGEAKRVALARSLAPAPRALLLDEPLTGLDRELHDRLAVEVGRILRAAGTTTLIVTHDRDEAAVVADRIVTTGELQGAIAERRRVVELTPEATHDLRRRVLRTGTPSTDVVFADDDAPTTLHLGLVDEQGTLIAISSWAWRPFPGDPSGGRSVQLRGMAVDPAHQGTGAGRPSSAPAWSGRGPTGPSWCGRTPGTRRSASTPPMASRPSATATSTAPRRSPTTASAASCADRRRSRFPFPAPGDPQDGRGTRSGVPRHQEVAVPTDPHADEYRRRAAGLRRLAARLDDSPLLVLHRWAGEDTWSSPRVDDCRAQLASDQTRIRAAADELRWEARRLDLRGRGCSRRRSPPRRRAVR